MTKQQPSLSEIWIYPVKSLGGIRVEKAVVTHRGLKYDRQWLVVDEDGTFLTQRQMPAMAKIGTDLVRNNLVLFEKDREGNSVKVGSDATTGPAFPVKVWKDSVEAFAVSDQADQWLSQQLNKKVRLVRLAENAERRAPVDQNKLISFADDFQFLLISQASLDDLNTRLPEPVPMNRFRPNFVISNTAPFEEDTWSKIKIGNLPFECISACERCVIVTIDQHSGNKSPEPLRTLAKFRLKDRKVRFGQNMIGPDSGIVQTGDLIYP